MLFRDIKHPEMINSIGGYGGWGVIGNGYTKDFNFICNIVLLRLGGGG